MGPEHWVAVRLRPSWHSMSGHYPPPPASPYAFTLDNRFYRDYDPSGAPGKRRNTAGAWATVASDLAKAAEGVDGRKASGLRHVLSKSDARPATSQLYPVLPTRRSPTGSRFRVERFSVGRAARDLSDGFPINDRSHPQKLPHFDGPQAASHVGQDDRSRRRINAARFRASLVQLRPASRRALGRGV